MRFFSCDGDRLDLLRLERRSDLVGAAGTRLAHRFGQAAARFASTGTTAIGNQPSLDGFSAKRSATCQLVRTLFGVGDQ